MKTSSIVVLVRADEAAPAPDVEAEVSEAFPEPHFYGFLGADREADAAVAVDRRSWYRPSTLTVRDRIADAAELVRYPADLLVAGVQGPTVQLYCTAEAAEAFFAAAVQMDPHPAAEVDAERQCLAERGWCFLEVFTG